MLFVLCGLALVWVFFRFVCSGLVWFLVLSFFFFDSSERGVQASQIKSNVTSLC